MVFSLSVLLLITGCINNTDKINEEVIENVPKIVEEKQDENVEINIEEYKNDDQKFNIENEKKINKDETGYIDNLKRDIEFYLSLKSDEKKNMLESDKIIMLKSISYLYYFTSNKEQFPDLYDEVFSLKAKREADLLYEELK